MLPAMGNDVGTSERASRGLWIALVIAALVIGGLGGWLLKPASTDATAAPTSAPTVTVTAPAPEQDAEEVPACMPDEVDTQIDDAGGAAGSQGVTITFTNNGPTSCALAGYPAVQFFYTSDQVPTGDLASPVEGVMPRVAELPANGGVAAAVVTMPDPAMLDDCTPFAPGAIMIIPPSGGGWQFFDSNLSICDSDDFVMTVSPVAASAEAG
jgi:hypothetical protein